MKSPSKKRRANGKAQKGDESSEASASESDEKGFDELIRKSPAKKAKQVPAKGKGKNNTNDEASEEAASASEEGMSQEAETPKKGKGAKATPAPKATQRGRKAKAAADSPLKTPLSPGTLMRL